jgi:SAM-dependent methyltransferase
LIRATIFATPFRSDSIDGIWNLGVMEHFSESEIQRSLQEFRRVLKPDGVIILFWPAEKNLSRWILGPIESFVTGWRRAKFTFFPGEITRLKSKHQAQLFLE